MLLGLSYVIQKRPSVKQSINKTGSELKIFRFTQVNLMIDPPLSTVTTALHCIQLYILSSFICCHYVLSYWTGQSYIYYFRKFLSISSCCCCAFDCILLLLLCITQINPPSIEHRCLAYWHTKSV